MDFEPLFFGEIQLNLKINGQREKAPAEERDSKSMVDGFLSCDAKENRHVQKRKEREKATKKDTHT